MIMELERLGVQVQSEVPVEVFFRGKKVHEEGFRIDLLVEELIVVELKSVEDVRDLRLAKKPLGLLINFNVPLLKEGITRIINTLPKAG